MSSSGRRGGRHSEKRRNHHDGDMETGKNRLPNPDMSDETRTMFLSYQEQLDARNNKYERLVKLSRDITIESKRVIFQLHRTVSVADSSTIIAEADAKLEQIRSENWAKVETELDGEDVYAFIRSITPSMQEYIEAVSLLCYMKTKTLLTKKEIQQSLSNLSGESRKIEVTLIDYLCGIADMTGELMRLAISSIAAGRQNMAFEICDFLTSLSGGFMLLGNLGSYSKDWSTKMRIFRQSLQKVENVCYLLKLRSSEVPTELLAKVLPAPKIDLINSEKLFNDVDYDANDY